MWGYLVLFLFGAFLYTWLTGVEANDLAAGSIKGASTLELLESNLQKLIQDMPWDGMDSAPFVFSLFCNFQAVWPRQGCNGRARSIVLPWPACNSCILFFGGCLCIGLNVSCSGCVGAGASSTCSVTNNARDLPHCPQLLQRITRRQAQLTTHHETDNT